MSVGIPQPVHVIFAFLHVPEMQFGCQHCHIARSYCTDSIFVVHQIHNVAASEHHTTTGLTATCFYCLQMTATCDTSEKHHCPMLCHVQCRQLWFCTNSTKDCKAAAVWTPTAFKKDTFSCPQYCYCKELNRRLSSSLSVCPASSVVPFLPTTLSALS